MATTPKPNRAELLARLSIADGEIGRDAVLCALSFSERRVLLGYEADSDGTIVASLSGCEWFFGAATRYRLCR